jgi:hypothetical protein
MGMIPIAFSREIFVVCRRGSGRGVTTIVSAAIDCVKIRIQYCDLTFFSSNFGRRSLQLLLLNGDDTDSIFLGGYCGVQAR